MLKDTHAERRSDPKGRSFRAATNFVDPMRDRNARHRPAGENILFWLSRTETRTRGWLLATWGQRILAPVFTFFLPNFGGRLSRSRPYRHMQRSQLQPSRSSGVQSRSSLPPIAAHCMSKLRAVRFDLVKEVEDRQAQGIRDHLDGVQRRVGTAVLDATQIRLIKTAPFAELNLAHAGRLSQRADARTKLLCQDGMHTLKCLGPALIRINTNSYLALERSMSNLIDPSKGEEVFERVWALATPQEREALLQRRHKLACGRSGTNRSARPAAQKQ